MAPQDPDIIYNVAYVLQKLGTKILKNENSNLDDVLRAINNLGLAHK